jgi:hypothetical protein
VISLFAAPTLNSAAGACAHAAAVEKREIRHAAIRSEDADLLISIVYSL